MIGSSPSTQILHADWSMAEYHTTIHHGDMYTNLMPHTWSSSFLLFNTKVVLQCRLYIAKVVFAIQSPNFINKVDFSDLSRKRCSCLQLVHSYISVYIGACWLLWYVDPGCSSSYLATCCYGNAMKASVHCVCAFHLLFWHRIMAGYKQASIVQKVICDREELPSDMTSWHVIGLYNIFFYDKVRMYIP